MPATLEYTTLDSHRGGRMKRYTMLVGAAAIAMIAAACQDQSMTGVDRSATEARAYLVVQNSPTMNGQYAIDDVIGRIVPALRDAEAAQGLVAALLGLQQAVDAGRAAEAPGLARMAQAELDRYARVASAEPAEVDAMRLALMAVMGS